MEVWHIGKYRLFSCNNLLIKIYSTMHRWVKQLHSHVDLKLKGQCFRAAHPYYSRGRANLNLYILHMHWFSLKANGQDCKHMGSCNNGMRCMPFYILTSTADCHIMTLINSTFKISRKIFNTCACLQLLYDNGATLEQVRSMILSSLRCKHFIHLRCFEFYAGDIFWESY